jgi:hypothetical protein
MDHPHPNKLHVVQSIRHYLLGFKSTHRANRRSDEANFTLPSGRMIKRTPNRSVRSLVHYKDLVQTYLTAKQQLKEGKVISKNGTKDIRN